MHFASHHHEAFHSLETSRYTSLDINWKKSSSNFSEMPSWQPILIMYDKHSNKSEIVGKKECMTDLDDTMILKEEKADFNNYSITFHS